MLYQMNKLNFKLSKVSRQKQVSTFSGFESLLHTRSLKQPTHMLICCGHFYVQVSGTANKQVSGNSVFVSFSFTFMSSDRSQWWLWESSGFDHSTTLKTLRISSKTHTNTIAIQQQRLFSSENEKWFNEIRKLPKIAFTMHTKTAHIQWED